jgi:hypothetical protein
VHRQVAVKVALIRYTLPSPLQGRRNDEDFYTFQKLAGKFETAMS